MIHTYQEFVYKILLAFSPILICNWTETPTEITLHFTDSSVCLKALDVKPVIYHNSWFTSYHVIVTYRTHSLNNKHRVWYIHQSTSTLCTECDAWFIAQPLHWSHTVIKKFINKIRRLQLKCFLMTVQIVAYLPLSLQHI